MRRKKGRPSEREINSQDYWNARLAAQGLSVDAGRDPRLSYLGSASDLEYIEGARRTDDGRIAPKSNDE